MNGPMNNLFKGLLLLVVTFIIIWQLQSFFEEQSAKFINDAAETTQLNTEEAGLYSPASPFSISDSI